MQAGNTPGDRSGLRVSVISGVPWGDSLIPVEVTSNLTSKLLDLMMSIESAENSLFSD